MPDPFSQPDPAPVRREVPPGYITREDAIARCAAILADRRIFRRGKAPLTAWGRRRAGLS